MSDQSLMGGRVIRRFNRIVCAALAVVLMSTGWGWAGGGWGGQVSRRAPYMGMMTPEMERLGKGVPQAPIDGSTVTFYAAGTTGYGKGASVLATTTSDSNGRFTIDSYTCPSASAQTYITATGGDVGHGDNPAIGMIALTGHCGSLTSSSFVMVNALTTVAADWALARFIDASGQTIGTSSTNASGLNNAVNLSESDLVVSYKLSGGNLSNIGVPASFLPTAAQCASGSPPVNCDGLKRLNTLANIIASCINSSGASSTQCRQLFCGATPDAKWNGTSCSKTPTPIDTLAATHAVVTNPTSNVSTIYGVPPPPGMTLYKPVLTAAPADWTLALNFNNQITPSANFDEPRGVALDSAGNAWVTNLYDGVTELNSHGGLVGNFNNSNTPGANFSYPQDVALDVASNVWVTNGGGNSVIELNSKGELVGNFAPAGANFDTPGGVALDSASNVWVTNYGFDGSVTELNSHGGLIGNFNNSNTPGANFSFPTAVALDNAGNAWVTNGSYFNSSVTELNSHGSLVGNFNNQNTPGANFNYSLGVALDSAGNAWVTNLYDGVTELNSHGGLIGNFNDSNTPGANINYPHGVALDSAGNAWVTNYLGYSVTELKSNGTLVGNYAPAGANFYGPWDAALDSAGNAWVTNYGSVTALIGLAAPVLTPMQACLKKGKNVCLPEARRVPHRRLTSAAEKAGAKATDDPNR